MPIMTGSLARFRGDRWRRPASSASSISPSRSRRTKGPSCTPWPNSIRQTHSAVELRLGTQNAWKIWLNGQFLFAR